MSTRSLGTIRAASLDVDHITTIWAYVDLDEGGAQGFGGVALTEPGILKSYREDLLAVFEKTHLEHLLGERCWVLKRRDSWQAHIEGLESLKGRRFTITGWQRKHGFPVKPFEEGETDWALADQAQSIMWSLRRILDKSQADSPAIHLAVRHLFEGLIDPQIDNLHISSWPGFAQLPKNYQHIIADEWRACRKRFDARHAEDGRPISVWERLMSNGK